MKKDRCVLCGAKLESAKVKIKGIFLDGLKCSKCGDKVFNENQVEIALSALVQKRLKDKYVKRPIKVGNSYAVLFPREIVKAFDLDMKDKFLDIRSDKANNKIEIIVN